MRLIRSGRLLSLFIAAAAAASPLGCGSTENLDPAERTTRAVAMYKQGVADFNEGRVDEAIATLKKANELQPGYTLLRFDLARMLLHRAQRNETNSILASESAREARQIGKPDKAKEKEDEARALYRRAVYDYQEARDLLLWVADQWGGAEANVDYFLSVAYTGLGEFRTARKHLERAIEIGNPTGPDREKLLRVLERLREAEAHQEKLGKAP